ncbi:hypothetical protein FGO68_gene14537 [Halteria grandinella]|uniref:Uncharacterized protein n=1 Tax=Halteria grandinella TaxID=5974 RepID=A0A8J8NK17_HALGN|nr:hypothetical protein FGO68_gene14537 [Halteria grandinella]
MGEFNIAEAVHSQKCPSCKFPIQHDTIKNFGFTGCYWSVIGKKVDDENLFEIKRRKAPSDKYSTFESIGSSNNADWFFLKVKTEEK